jgi:hypothetical protein
LQRRLPHCIGDSTSANVRILRAISNAVGEFTQEGNVVMIATVGGL